MFPEALCHEPGVGERWRHLTPLSTGQRLDKDESDREEQGCINFGTVLLATYASRCVRIGTTIAFAAGRTTTTTATAAAPAAACAAPSAWWCGRDDTGRTGVSSPPSRCSPLLRVLGRGGGGRREIVVLRLLDALTPSRCDHGPAVVVVVDGRASEKNLYLWEASLVYTCLFTLHK